MQHPKIRNSQLIDKIFSTQSLLEKVGNEVIFKKFHITTSLYGTLKMIDAGLHSIGEMKQFTTESPPSLTQKTHKLEKAKFINRKTHPLDKRIWNFSLTAKGRSIIKKIDSESNQHACMFQKFSRTEKETFYKILHELENQMLTTIKNQYEKN